MVMPLGGWQGLGRRREPSLEVQRKVLMPNSMGRRPIHFGTTFVFCTSREACIHTMYPGGPPIPLNRPPFHPFPAPFGTRSRLRETVGEEGMTPTMTKTIGQRRNAQGRGHNGARAATGRPRAGRPM
jgi:hypothetical protein